MHVLLKGPFGDFEQKTLWLQLLSFVIICYYQNLAFTLPA